METVRISPKFQIVIPKSIRDSMHLKPGQTMQIVQYGSRIEIFPVKTVNEMCGFLKGMNIDFVREDDRL